MTSELSLVFHLCSFCDHDKFSVCYCDRPQRAPPSLAEAMILENPPITKAVEFCPELSHQGLILGQFLISFLGFKFHNYIGRN